MNIGMLVDVAQIDMHMCTVYMFGHSFIIPGVFLNSMHGHQGIPVPLYQAVLV